jgi:hypothetical protein
MILTQGLSMTAALGKHVYKVPEYKVGGWKEGRNDIEEVDRVQIIKDLAKNYLLSDYNNVLLLIRYLETNKVTQR